MIGIVVGYNKSKLWKNIDDNSVIINDICKKKGLIQSATTLKFRVFYGQIWMPSAGCGIRFDTGQQTISIQNYETTDWVDIKRNITICYSSR